MGDDFVAEVHQELFDQYISFDSTKPWAKQSNTYKRLILWPRGHFKTRSIVVEILQIIINFPDIRILIMQGGLTNTRTLLHMVKSHFTGENSRSRIPELFPEFCADKLGNQDQFTVPARKNKGLAQATVTVASPRSIKTGQHYDVGFFDDLVHDQNYRSAKLLQKVREDFNMCMPLIDPPHYAYMSGTRYAFGDTYEEVMRNNKGEWKVSLKTCYLEDGETIRFPQQATRDGDGTIGFTAEGLRLLRDNDPEMFASQYLNQPAQRGGQRFTKAVMEAALIAPQEAPPLSAPLFFVDLASTDGDRSDDSVVIVGKHDTLMNQYVVDARGDRWLPPVLAQNIIDMALIHRPHRIYFEKSSACRYFVDFLRLVAKQHNIFLPIDFLEIDTRPDSKHIRIASLEPLIKSRRLRFFVGLSCWEKIVYQFGRFPGPRNRKDDYPDTIAYMAHTFGGEALAQPIQRIIKDPILAMMAQRERDTAHVMDDEPIDESDGFYAF